MPEPAGRLTITVLGSGTSVGVPTLCCPCEVCHSDDPRDQRLRPSVALRWDGHCVVIDTGPDFRQQALRAQLPRIDAVLYTHGHADHILGLDDLRPFNYTQHEIIPVYGSEETMKIIRRVFDYIFHEGPTESSRPKIKTHAFDGRPINLFGVEFQPIPVKHGKGPCHGFRFGKAAYLTDHSEVPEESLEMLRGLDVLFLDALRYTPHPTHSTVEQSLKIVERLKPRQTWFTHISHDLSHKQAGSLLPAGVGLAYDGLEVAVGL
jgi:phosphoribosyl 1,2-cyclic phosphate phosphodiesterase